MKNCKYIQKLKSIESKHKNTHHLDFIIVSILLSLLLFDRIYWFIHSPLFFDAFQSELQISILYLTLNFNLPPILSHTHSRLVQNLQAGCYALIFDLDQMRYCLTSFSNPSMSKISCLPRKQSWPNLILILSICPELCNLFNS